MRTIKKVLKEEITRLQLFLENLKKSCWNLKSSVATAAEFPEHASIEFNTMLIFFSGYFAK